MKTFDDLLLARYHQLLTFPALDQGRFADDLLVISLPAFVFPYRREDGYDFETACMRHAATGERLWFVRIDAWDPQVRSTSDIDYCIPLAYDGASDAERLRWTIGFGGAWSDTREAALLVFDERWRDRLARVTDRIVFANPGVPSGALFRIDRRQRRALDAFVGAPHEAAG